VLSPPFAVSSRQVGRWTVRPNRRVGLLDAVDHRTVRLERLLALLGGTAFDPGGLL
jgi:hypothetical protein